MFTGIVKGIGTVRGLTLRPGLSTLAIELPVAGDGGYRARLPSRAVPHDCLDGFCCAYWRRPDAYLDPGVRACISGLARLPPDEVLPGIARLRSDLDSGRWHERHRKLIGVNEFDGGYRLVVRE